MRKLLPVFLLALPLAFGGCAKKFVHFYMNYSTEITVPATPATTATISLQTPQIVTNSTAQFDHYDTRKEKVQSIVLKQVKLTIADSIGETFGFLQSAGLYLSSDGLPELLVASNDVVVDTIGNELLLTPIATDLKEYVKATKFRLRLKIVTDETVVQDVPVGIRTTFFVDARQINKKK